ncbi:MAG: hypothetical protein K0U84_01800 [Actinomycetia bacterium]|nr:hypothetical protein [Actinomycetes bacterium]
MSPGRRLLAAIPKFLHNTPQADLKGETPAHAADCVDRYQCRACRWVLERMAEQ